MQNIQIYVYKNRDGRTKALAVNWDRQKENKYYCLLRDLKTSEQYGGVYKTKKEITVFLAQYGVKI